MLTFVAGRMRDAPMNLQAVQGTIIAVTLQTSEFSALVQMDIAHMLLQIVPTAAILSAEGAIQRLLLSFTCNTIKRKE